mgnify:CR=1 FL=1
MRRTNTVLYSSSRIYTGRIQRPDGLSISSINWANSHRISNAIPTIYYHVNSDSEYMYCESAKFSPKKQFLRKLSQNYCIVISMVHIVFLDLDKFTSVHVLPGNYYYSLGIIIISVVIINFC